LRHLGLGTDGNGWWRSVAHNPLSAMPRGWKHLAAPAVRGAVQSLAAGELVAMR
jgi:hypothetical protein